MGKSLETKPKKWVTVPMDEKLHGDVRAEGVRQHKPWPVIQEEAMKMWLAVQHRRAA
jgi:hypothetical protein